MTTSAYKSGRWASVEPEQRRMLVQRRAPATVRSHWVRAVGRVVGLVAADLGSFAGLWWLAHRAVDAGWIRGAFGEVMGIAMPAGGFWQASVALILGLSIAGTYRGGDHRRLPTGLFSGVALGAGLSLWSTIWLTGAFAGFVVLASVVALVWPVVALDRWILDYTAARLLPQQKQRVLFVGDQAKPASAGIMRTLELGDRIEPVGWIWNADADPGNHSAYLGSTEDIWTILSSAEADTVVLCDDLTDEHFESVVEASTSAGCKVLWRARLGQRTRLRSGMVWRRGVPFVELTIPALKAQQWFVKRVIDIVGSLLGLVLLGPVLIVVAVIVKSTSTGPVLFSQERVGYAGGRFRLLKFRTMREGADGEKESMAHLNRSGDSRLFKIESDPRVTPVGEWIRRWSLDELPQLWNVLAGHMSLVGPRPFFESDLARYHDHHFNRLEAKPGITGLWQVEGRSDVVDFEEVIRLDLEYIDRWSLWLDFKIMLATIPAVFGRSGAY